MENLWRNPLRTLCGMLLLGFGIGAQAATISVLPPTVTPTWPADATADLEIVIDFTGEPTVGGGIGLTAAGPISIAGFTPSAFFSGLDPAFTGFGFGGAIPAADFEIHFGDFLGISSAESLGFLTVNLAGAGLAGVSVADNTVWGGWPGTVAGPVTVSFNSAEFLIQPVPLPAAAWLFASALGMVAGLRRRRHQS